MNVGELPDAEPREVPTALVTRHMAGPVRSAMALALVGITVFAGAASHGPESETPLGPQWWPSKYGPEDMRGAANLITPEKTVAAAQLIKLGQIYQLGRLYEHGMPLPGKRHFSITIPGLPTGSPMGENQLVHNDELVSGEIGQVGTQFDGLGHIGVAMENDARFYNGFKLSEFGDSYGLKKLGVENAGAFFTRGILLDVAAAKGVRNLENGYVITPQDLEDCLAKTGHRLTPGDVVLIRTGHGQLWMVDNETFAAGEPGIGLAAAKWLADQQVAIVGSDNWAIEVVPSENADRPYEVHQHLLVRHGIYLLENLDLEALAADNVTEFAFSFAPLRLKGATGSPGNPVAIR